MLYIIHLPRRTDRWNLLIHELREQNINDYKIWDGIEDFSAPWKGVAKAHKQIVRYAQEQNQEIIMIAEDDIKFTAPGAFEYFINNIPADFDLYLAGIIHGKINPDQTVNDFSGRTFYIIHSRFYETYLNLPEDYHQDRALKNKGRFVVCNPMTVIQYNGYSDNNRRMMDYGPYLKGRSLYNSSLLNPYR
jgi:hypothetical protein